MEENDFGGFEACFSTKFVDDGVMMAVVDKYHAFDDPIATERPTEKTAGVFCVARGEMAVRYDLNELTCNARQNNMFCISPSSSVRSIDISDDFKGYILMLNSNFMHDNMGFIGMRPKIDMAALPVYTISEQDRLTILTDINRIEHCFEHETHRCYHQKIKLAVLGMFCDLIDAIGNSSPMITFVTSRRGRHDELCRRFMVLLNENVRTRHDVAFYADRLCITPQYLTKISKIEFGRTAGQMIDSGLMREAVIMLRTTDLSVVEIADRLAFADGASFSKFFRKHQGISPSQYRKRL